LRQRRKYFGLGDCLLGKYCAFFCAAHDRQAVRGSPQSKLPDAGQPSNVGGASSIAASRRFHGAPGGAGDLPRQGLSLIEWIAQGPQHRLALSHGCCVRCWFTSPVIRRIAICVTDRSLESLLRRKLVFISSSPLRRSLVTASAGAVAFTDCRM
jgi:hypothetical protein